MRGNVQFIGHAIVTADGMIADADGSMPPALRNDADWRLFQAALDASVLVVLGRIGAARHPNPGRRRLVLTRSVTALAPDASDALAMLWNPDGMGIPEMLDALAVTDGMVAVTGGTGTFDVFLPELDSFLLSEVHDAVLSGGVPCFSAGHPRTVLAEAGLRPGLAELIDSERGVTLTRWSRPT